MGLMGQMPLGIVCVGCLTPVRREMLGYTHKYTMTFFHTLSDWSRASEKIHSAIPFKESISSTILFPREDKIYTLLTMKEFHKPLEVLVREFSKC